MLLAYIDEIGQSGAFVSHEHPRYNESPAFGYAGFVLPAASAREFGAYFTHTKRNLYSTLIEKDNLHPGRFEVKGADLLYAKVHDEQPQNLRVLASLFSTLRNFNGTLFYYAAEKPIGTPKETNTGSTEIVERESEAMRETLNRIARHAEYCDEPVMVMMDQINEKSRKQRLPQIYSHILGRAAEHEDMKRIIEPPMHIDSELSSNIQFADWIAAFTKRAIDYQLVKNSRYKWLPDSKPSQAARGAFTYESKLRFYQRSLNDINHANILNSERTLYPSQSTMTAENIKRLEQVRKASFK